KYDIQDCHVTGVQTCPLPIYAERYGLFCYDEWPETVEPAQYEEIDGEQVLVREAVTHPAGNRYGVRGVQLSMFLIAAQEQRLRRSEEGRVGDEERCVLCRLM